MESLDNKNGDIDRKLLENMLKNQFLKIKNSLLKLEKKFLELKDKELKDRDIKVIKEIEQLFFEPIKVSKYDMDMCEQIEMNKIRPIKNTCYDWLIDYIPKHNSSDGFKDKIMCLFKTNTPKQIICGKGNKKRKPKPKNIRKKLRKNKEYNAGLIRDIRILFEQQQKEDYYKPIRTNSAFDG